MRSGAWTTKWQTAKNPPSRCQALFTPSPSDGWIAQCRFGHAQNDGLELQPRKNTHLHYPVLTPHYRPGLTTTSAKSLTVTIYSCSERERKGAREATEQKLWEQHALYRHFKCQCYMASLQQSMRLKIYSGLVSRKSTTIKSGNN